MSSHLNRENATQLRAPKAECKSIYLYPSKTPQAMHSSELFMSRLLINDSKKRYMMSRKAIRDVHQLNKKLDTSSTFMVF